MGRLGTVIDELPNSRRILDVVTSWRISPQVKVGHKRYDSLKPCSGRDLLNAKALFADTLSKLRDFINYLDKHSVHLNTSTTRQNRFVRLALRGDQ